MLGFRSGFGLNMAGVEDLGVGCRAVGEAGGGGGGSVGGGSCKFLHENNVYRKNGVQHDEAGGKSFKTVISDFLF